MKGRSRNHGRFLLLTLASLVAALSSISPAHAAFVVYADSWVTPTQAQEQASVINRALSISTATYERATVEQRVFWRVRVGYFRTRQDAMNARNRLTARGISDSWMREVPDADVPGLAPARPPAPPTARLDTVRVDSLTRTLVDSISFLTRRAVDSLGHASEQRLDEVIERMRSRLSADVMRQIEQDRSSERLTYVTQMEQAQMTRALLDEMHANFDAMRDSLQRVHEERLRINALAPDINGSVTVVASATHERPESSSRQIRTFGATAEVFPFLAASWSGDRTEVMVEFTATNEEPELREAFVHWNARQSDRSTTTVGIGKFGAPYGLEPTDPSALRTPAPSIIDEYRPGTLTGMWLEPYRSPSARILLMPYGSWDADRDQVSGLAQLRLTPGNWRVEATGIADRWRGGDRDEILHRYTTSVVVERRTDVWEVGAEVRSAHTRAPVAEAWDMVAATERGEILFTAYRRIGNTWGWALRGAYVDVYDDFVHYTIPEHVASDLIAEATTGPVFQIGDRMTVRAAYTYVYRDYEPLGDNERSHTHSFAVAFSHTF